jgi:hypothetical protein
VGVRVKRPPHRRQSVGRGWEVRQGLMPSLLLGSGWTEGGVSGGQTIYLADDRSDYYVQGSLRISEDQGYGPGKDR